MLHLPNIWTNLVAKRDEMIRTVPVASFVFVSFLNKKNRQILLHVVGDNSAVLSDVQNDNHQRSVYRRKKGWYSSRGSVLGERVKCVSLTPRPRCLCFSGFQPSLRACWPKAKKPGHCSASSKLWVRCVAFAHRTLVEDSFVQCR